MMLLLEERKCEIKNLWITDWSLPDLAICHDM